MSATEVNAMTWALGWLAFCKQANTDRQRIAELEAALINVVARLEWALKFTGALTATDNELNGGKVFVLNYDEANWDNADEWRPVALRHLTRARKALLP